MKTSTSISCVRHGEFSNPKELYAGRLPGFELSKVGRHQAEKAERALSNKKIVAVFSSPSLRTRQTARIILTQHPSLNLRISRYLNEVYCPFDGCPRKEIENRKWDTYTGTKFPYEQPSDVLKRSHLFISRVRRLFPGKHVVAATHGDVIAFLKLWATNKAITPENKQIDYPAPASIHTFTYHTLSPDEIPDYVCLKPY